MTKKIKFALKMGGGTGVRTLDDFRDHFDLPTALEHFFSGKLEQWRYAPAGCRKVGAQTVFAD